VARAPWIADPTKPKCALCGVNLTSHSSVMRGDHENGKRHKENMVAVLVAMKRETVWASALANLEGEGLQKALGAMRKAVVAMNDKGQSPWLAVSGDFFNNKAAASAEED